MVSRKRGSALWGEHPCTGGSRARGRSGEQLVLNGVTEASRGHAAKRGKLSQVVDRRRFPTDVRFRVATAADRPRGLPHVYRGRARRGGIRDVYDADHVEPRQGERFRWLISTCLAAAVGAVALIVAIFGAADQNENQDGILPTLKRLGDSNSVADLAPQRRDDGLKWALPKTDRMEAITGASSTRFVIHDTVKQKKAGREYIHAKPYVRIVARLAPVPQNYADVVPPFNPVRLYSDSSAITTSESDGDAGDDRSDVSIKVQELLSNSLPGEDGQELETQEVVELVEGLRQAEAAGSQPGNALERPNGASLPAGNGAGLATPGSDAAQAHTTVLAKSVHELDDDDDALDGGQERVFKVGPGDTLAKILNRAGADMWQTQLMIDATKAVFPANSLAEGQEVHITLVASLTQQNRLEPARFSIFSDGHQHLVTVRRSPAGEFIASASPPSSARSARARPDDRQSSSLYAGLYYASLVQQVPPETIMRVLRTHAYEADFGRRLLGGDTVELFFDLKDENATDGPPGELLYSAITTKGETSRFYRYRTGDDVVDYYDAEGSNSRKFLIKRPVQFDARITSGYGPRFHPLLNEKRMHTGVDWAAPTGIPVLAAGKGIIEEAGRKGQYGNYIRIRHSNGYQTAYGHMSRFAEGVKPGVKVRQNDVIGYVGSTGLSSGPHLHFEVLVNSQFVDPTKIQVPQERRLAGKELADFQKERARIDELIRRVPVKRASK